MRATASINPAPNPPPISQPVAASPVGVNPPHPAPSRSRCIQHKPAETTSSTACAANSHTTTSAYPLRSPLVIEPAQASPNAGENHTNAPTPTASPSPIHGRNV